MTTPLQRAQTAQARFYERLAEKTKLETESLKINKAAYEAGWENQRIYNFIGAVNVVPVEEAIATLGQWQREDASKPITVILNTLGGEIISGLALFDYIQHLNETGTPVDIHGLGYAASMGAILLQAGRKRLIGKHSYLLIHEVSGVALGNMSEIEDQVEFTKGLQERALDILTEKSTMTRRQIQRHWKRKDWWLNASEAVELGFADGVL